MKKTGIVIMVSLLLFAANIGLFANETDNQVLGIEVGMVAGYRLSDNAIVSGQNFSLNITVSEKVQVGFNSLSIAGATPVVTNDYAFLKISYFMSPKLGLNILAGTDGTNPATGAGIFYNILEDKDAEGISTAFKLRIDYVFDSVAGPAAGSVALGLSASFGL